MSTWTAASLPKAATGCLSTSLVDHVGCSGGCYDSYSSTSDDTVSEDCSCSDVENSIDSQNANRKTILAKTRRRKKECLAQSEVYSVRNNICISKTSRPKCRRASFPRDNLKTTTSLSGDCCFCRGSTKTNSPLSLSNYYPGAEVASNCAYLKNPSHLFPPDCPGDRSNVTPTTNNSSDLCLRGQEELELRHAISRRCSGSWCGPNDLTNEELGHSCSSLRRTTRVFLAPIETNGQVTSSSPLRDFMNFFSKCNKISNSNFKTASSLVSNHQPTMTHASQVTTSSSLVNCKSSPISASKKGAISSSNGASSVCHDKPVSATERITLVNKLTKTTSAKPSLELSGDVAPVTSLSINQLEKSNDTQETLLKDKRLSGCKPLVCVETIESEDDLSPCSKPALESVSKPNNETQQSKSSELFMTQKDPLSRSPSTTSVSTPAFTLPPQRKVQIPLSGQITVNAKIRRSSSRRKKGREEDDLSEVDASAVPEEVRDWLATTFTRKMGVRKDGDKPKFKSIVNALRAGMFVERMFRRMSGLQGLSYPTALIPHLKLIDEWSVDMFALNDAASGSSLKYVTYELLNRYDLVSKFKIPVSNLINFLDRIEAGYSTHSNPYHNLIHGADITQTCHYFMLQTGLMNWLTDLEIFAVLIAACCHDVEHTGTTNNFHINTQSSLALLYNDKSVLENHHVSYMFRTMHDFADCNILCNLSRDDFMEFRQLTVDMILATDMSFHFSQLKSMKAAILQPEPIEKTKALSLVLHTADIAHPAKEWNVHYRWTMLVIEEFFRQGDREFELGLPYSPLCDRHTLVIPDSQIGFINFIVAPSMEVCSDMLDKIVAPMEKLSRGTIEETPSPSVEGDPAGAKGESAKNASNGCPTFSIERPWDPHITSNRDTWKQKSVEEERKKQEKAADVAKSEDESSASKNGQSEVKSESPAKSDIKNGTNEEERKETSGGQTSQAPANSTKAQLSYNQLSQVVTELSVEKSGDTLQKAATQKELNQEETDDSSLVLQVRKRTDPEPRRLSSVN